MLGVLAALTLGATALLVTQLGPAEAATACSVTYRVNEWTGGFVGYVDITAGATAIHGWNVTWTYGGDQHITSGWGATVTQTGANVTAVNLSYNADVNPGATVEFGVQGTWSAADPTPTTLLLNGAPCGTAPSPSASAASPSPSVSPSRSASPSPSVSPSRSASPSASASPSVSPSASPSVSPSTSPGAGCGSLALCDGFENQSGSTPSGAWQATYQDCQGAGTAVVDSTVAYRGAKSLKINGAEGYCNHVFAKATANLTGIGPIWYARFYVRHTTALPTAHVTFAALKDSADGGKDLRMGGQNGALQWNRQSDDATLPEQSPAGVALSVPLPVNSWNCVQFMVNGTAGTMSTWLNGTEVAGLHEDGVATHDVDSQWLGRAGWHPAPADFRLGWESYGVGTDTLWFDEVALSATPISC
ncbi:cellulose binding domain-containing protein [Hamadaea tsunoensis]|uniref:cellulose binding domain-containing protein n=1 Tax=Hamadaea tsunoensis TaxID=53368 RepID=UPI00055653B9|nr:cellulose binding domain-containing protein [Hamadaea tsunoensis]